MMPSAWGKEFLIFLNLVKYGLILMAMVWIPVVVVRMIQRMGRANGEAKKSDEK